jgi:hypothetical protein
MPSFSRILAVFSSYLWSTPSHKVFISFCAIVEFIIMARFSNHHLPTGTAVLLIVAWFSGSVVTTTMAQFATCSNARVLAMDVLSQIYRESPCQSACSSGIVCDQDCIDGSDAFAIGCVDPCVSQALDGYAVVRSSSAAAGVGYLLSSAVPIITQGYTHTFSTGGTAAGTLSNIYEGVATTRGTTQAALGQSCTFKFNGSACVCTQIYCDIDQTRYGFKIDCSSLPGGSIVNECVVPTPTADSTLLDILFYTPFLPRTCPDDSSGGVVNPSPVAVPTAAVSSPLPVVAPTSVVAPPVVAPTTVVIAPVVAPIAVPPVVAPSVVAAANPPPVPTTAVAPTPGTNTSLPNPPVGERPFSGSSRPSLAVAGSFGGWSTGIVVIVVGVSSTLFW